MTETDAAIEVQVQRLAHADGLDLPSYQTAGSAGVSSPRPYRTVT